MASENTPIKTTCPYCGVGCGVEAELRGQELVTVAGDAEHPANRGRLCVKGSALAETQRHMPRLLQPQVRGRSSSWDQAIDAAAAGFRAAIDEFGPGAVAFYLSGQLLTEDYYVANKLMKGFLGSANVDTNSRLCMSSAVSAHKRAFGEDVVPVTYEDIDQADLIVLVGSNAAWAHPVLYQRIVAAREARGCRVVVIDPRRTATCDSADLHLPLKPGSDVALFNGLFCALDQAQCADEAFLSAHVDGLAASRDAAAADTNSVSDETGLTSSQLGDFYRLFADHERVITVFSQGVNQSSSGTDKANAIINCHLLTGRIGRPGMGPFSITGQPNAMGGREVGGLATQLAAHMDFGAEAVDRTQRFWNAPRMATEPGLTATALFEAIANGQVKAVWIMGTNPAVSLPKSARVAEALERCPLVVVSDCVPDNDTLRFADIRLPALGWGEKNGTVTNSERVISRQRALLPAPGNARADWAAICDFAKALGFNDGFNYRGPAEIFREHAALSAFENQGERQFNLEPLASLSDAQYDALAPVRWPLTGPAFPQHRYSTANSHARLIPVRQQSPQEAPSAAFPLRLNSGRLRDQWHTMTRTGSAARLLTHRYRPEVALHPHTAVALGVSAGDLLRVTSPHGQVLLPAVLDQGQRPSELFVPIHWNRTFAASALVNALFDAHIDAHSGQPESKHTVARVDVVAGQTWGRLTCARSFGSDEDPTRVQQDGYWCRVALGEAQSGLEWSAPEAQTAVLIRHLEQRLAADDCLELTLEQPTGTERRWLLLAAGQVVAQLATAPSSSLLPEWPMLTRALCQPGHWRLFGDQGDVAATSPVVCSCYEVREADISAAIAKGAESASALGAALKCGTNCGSCIPELNQLIEARKSPVEALATS